MPVLPHLVAANNVYQMMGKINNVIDFFDNRDAANEIIFAPNGTITDTNVQGAVVSVNIQANTKINTLRSQVVANVAMLNTSITNTETKALDNAVALAIALG